MSDILTLLKSKDEKGLSMLYDNYAPALMGIISRIVHGDLMGEEILQQTFLKVWNNVENYDNTKGSFFTWLASIARNAALDQVRLKGFQVRRNIESLDPKSHPVGSTSQSSDSIDANKLVEGLEEKYKSVLDLIYLNGFTHQDAADELNIPLGTVKTRLRIAIKILREELKGERELFLGLLLLIIFLILML